MTWSDQFRMHMFPIDTSFREIAETCLEHNSPSIL